MGGEPPGQRADATWRVDAHVSGRVQGVGFRMFAQRQAEQAGCTGYVRNSDDGSTVEVLAEGSRAALEQLLAALRRGPRLAHVAAVAAEWSPASGEFRAFQIRE